VFVTATNIRAAYANGMLRPTDILLTDGVPAELPYVAGIITFAAATPNSHVAILAQSYDVPFVFIADQSMRERILREF
jgi:phosphoenolpyruvate-protein kinase (PTS system EI component)